MKTGPLGLKGFNGSFTPRPTIEPITGSTLDLSSPRDPSEALSGSAISFASSGNERRRRSVYFLCDSLIRYFSLVF